MLITHTFTTGPSQELCDFFIKKNIEFAFLEHPFSYNRESRHSKLTFFEKGKEVKSLEGADYSGNDLFHFIKDFLYTFYFIIKAREKYDICIAVDNLNATASFFLKKLGYFKNSIYWTIDYTPKRFGNNLLNNIYHSLDKFCCYHSNLLWNSSKRMNPARAKNGVNLPKCAREVIVPDGCHFEEIERINDDKVDRFKLVFMGHLVKNKGVDFLINSLPDLLQAFPQITLTIIGTGPEESNLRNLTKKLNLDDKVFFTGYIKSHKQVEKVIASCGVGLSPYVPDPNSYTFFSDVGKVKVYLACGLPVLITDVPEIAMDLQKNKAGLIFKYNKQSFVSQAKFLLENADVYFQYRNNAISYIRNLSWDNVLNGVLIKTVCHLNAT
jgi:glycosyltransferase involved in cell wall biosynthesis